ncbi:RHS repeat-associated core domain-containing protein [Pseudomonas asturiensis]|uniref:RHS repeat-associated core domain-containing protein n=2 Tax=Pseudomonas asturiensis TaxID=1190415 RepID=A0A1M7PEQ5_9PSED|nr:RHS repeat-associated core domain-containing protein [Pseudomonas asturiensis]SHN15470.1 RHS repeat-associated core domain-containing protein [Pseudomonas asturiensis]
MGFSAQTALCRYRYDALDRLTASAPATDTEVQWFYQKNRLAIEIQGDVQRRLVQHEAVLLAQKQRAQGEASTNMLATDQHRSVLQRLLGAGLESLAYTPYGHHPVESDQTFVPGFNGEPCDPVTGHYLLGNGYRAFNPVLMRFNSPDSLSPFEDGGLNAYAYCEGDPVNFDDPTGHMLGYSALLKMQPAKRAMVFGAEHSSLPRVMGSLPAGHAVPGVGNGVPVSSTVASTASVASRSPTQPIPSSEVNVTSPSVAKPGRSRKRNALRDDGAAKVKKAKREYESAMESFAVTNSLLGADPYLLGRLDARATLREAAYRKLNNEYMDANRSKPGFSQAAFDENRTLLNAANRRIETYAQTSSEVATIRQ